MDKPRKRESAGAEGRIVCGGMLTIKSIVRNLEVEDRDWKAGLLAGYFCRSMAP
jgi:hypothetical protein